jgi:pSer/pThr/pTyr-binding forkhead associated (FHA) protein
VSEQLLELLKLCLLALLYLFLLRVVWAVGSQLRTPAAIGSGGGSAPPRADSADTATKSKGASRRASRSAMATTLVLRAPADRAGTTYDLVDGLSIGRAVGNTVTLDDTFVSQHHARLLFRDGTWVFEDLRSTNGSLHNGTRVGQPVPVRTGDRIQIGDSVLEVR